MFGGQPSSSSFPFGSQPPQSAFGQQPTNNTFGSGSNQQSPFGSGSSKSPSQVIFGSALNAQPAPSPIPSSGGPNPAPGRGGGGGWTQAPSQQVSSLHAPIDSDPNQLILSYIIRRAHFLHPLLHFGQATPSQAPP